MNSDVVLRELEGMRALARSLAHGDAEADDLLQDAAIAAIESAAPAADAPPRAWLAVVLRNRKRMNLRAAARRDAREQAMSVIADEVERPDAALDRARAFERLAAALVALEEPFRTTVIRRYLDGETAAQIAKAMDIPAGTVRWRLKTGLDRLRSALDDSEPRWKRAFLPFAPFAPTTKALAGAALMKSKISIVIALVLLLIGGAVLYGLTMRDKPAKTVATAPAKRGVGKPIVANKVPIDKVAEAALPPGQGKVILDGTTGPGIVSGRVINWSTGDGVDGAEITFTNEAGATTVRSKAGGAFELTPEAPGHFVLTTISAPGFLPYAPELLHSTVHVEVVKDRAVRGITVFLFPAVDYTGVVVDEKLKPVPGAKVRLLGTPTGEQAIEKLETEWTSDKDGKFVFHAADDAVLEAVRGNQRGYGMLDSEAALTHVMTIAIGTQAKPRDRTITGKVVDAGKPVANVLVRAEPQEMGLAFNIRAYAFATSNSDGTFALEDVDDNAYVLSTQADGYAQATLEPVLGGARDVVLPIDRGRSISGRVVDAGADPVPAYTLLVFQRRGARRDLVHATSIVDATGRFEVRVPAGDYDLQASASGWAPSAFTKATAGARDLELTVSAGATLRGQVVAADGSGPIPYARVMREARGGGASAQPSNAGTVTRDDGSFELSGIPPGPVAITVAGGGFHPKIEAGMTASDGAKLGPITISLVKLKPGEKPSLELVGIGVKLSGMGKEGITILDVFAGSGAAEAGITANDEMVMIDGMSVAELGLDGAIAKIRGVEGTTVSVTVKRGDKLLPFVVTRKKLRA